MRKICLSLIALFLVILSSAQDLSYVHSCIDSLASPRFQGRGYVNNGDQIASEFLVKNLKEAGLKFFNSGYLQHYYLSINTFPGKIELKADDKKLIPGKDYFVSLSSPSISGTFNVFWITGNTLRSAKDLKNFQKKDLSNTALIVDTSFHGELDQHAFTAKALIRSTSKPMCWDAADGLEVIPFASIDVSREKIPDNCKEITLTIESSFKENYQTQNVIAYIPGSQYADSFFVFIAHYDHLGRMGSEVYFPGAHDNASGCAMALDLAKYYSMPEHQDKYSIAFIFLSGEEAGLLGSGFYVNHPLFPLKNIKFLINLDMETTGSAGIKVVNATVFKPKFDLLVKLNDENQFLKTVSPRGEAANSDHFRFYKKGVPCFYIYTLGDEWKEYHVPTDVSAGIPMTKYNELFKLVTKFISALAK